MNDNSSGGLYEIILEVPIGRTQFINALPLATMRLLAHCCFDALEVPVY